MAGNPYLAFDTTLGHPRQNTGTQTSAGAGDAGKIVALDANGKLASTMMPTGFGDETVSIVTSENLAAGNLVNIYDNAGTTTARKADGSTTGKQCDGYVIAATTSPAAATVYFEGFNNSVTGLTGGPVYLSQTTPGLATNTIPTTAGGLAQRVGRAVSATSLDFEPNDPIAL